MWLLVLRFNRKADQCEWPETQPMNKRQVILFAILTAQRLSVCISNVLPCRRGFTPAIGEEWNWWRGAVGVTVGVDACLPLHAESIISDLSPRGSLVLLLLLFIMTLLLLLLIIIIIIDLSAFIVMHQWHLKVGDGGPVLLGHWFLCCCCCCGFTHPTTQCTHIYCPRMVVYCCT